MDKIITAIMTLSLSSFALMSTAAADEIKAMFPAAMKRVMTELIPEFEKSSGDKIDVEYGTVGAIIARLKAGGALDVAVVTEKQLPGLTKQGLISADGEAVRRQGRPRRLRAQRRAEAGN